MQIKKTILTESVTLEELRKIIREGRAAEVLAVGDQIYINFDGAAVPYDVIGIDADTPAAEELKHTVTIQAHELIEERPFDTKGCYGSNDWETSELREYLNSETYAARCAELAKYAIPVTKMNTNGRKTLDTFFLLSVAEYDAKDTPYEYYKDKPYRAAKHAKDDFRWDVKPLNALLITLFARINRYIVGCKVNRNAMSALLHVRINRYIVGCKGEEINRLYELFLELIDT